MTALELLGLFGYTSPADAWATFDAAAQRRLLDVAAALSTKRERGDVRRCGCCGARATPDGTIVGRGPGGVEWTAWREAGETPERHAEQVASVAAGLRAMAASAGRRLTTCPVCSWMFCEDAPEPTEADRHWRDVPLPRFAIVASPASASAWQRECLAGYSYRADQRVDLREVMILNFDRRAGELRRGRLALVALDHQGAAIVARTSAAERSIERVKRTLDDFRQTLDDAADVRAKLAAEDAEIAAGRALRTHGAAGKRAAS